MQETPYDDAIRSYEEAAKIVVEKPYQAYWRGFLKIHSGSYKEQATAYRRGYAACKAELEGQLIAWLEGNGRKLEAYGFLTEAYEELVDTPLAAETLRLLQPWLEEVGGIIAKGAKA